MDQILASTDTQLPATTSDERRSSIVASMLAVPPIDLSTFVVAMNGLPESIDQIDTSYLFLIKSLHMLQSNALDLNQEPGQSILRYMPNAPGGQGAQFLTYLDAYACLPESRRTETMEERVQLIHRLYDELPQISRRVFASTQGWDTNPYESTLLKMKLHVYSSRLILYVAHLQGWEQDRLTSELITNFQACFPMLPTEPVLSFPVLRNQLADIRTWCENQRMLLRIAREPQAGFWDDVAWQKDEPAECSICLLPLESAAVLTNPCSHPLCEDCLETWIHAGQDNSHRCPMCRTELFAKPSYQHQPPSLEEDRENEDFGRAPGRWIDPERLAEQEVDREDQQFDEMLELWLHEARDVDTSLVWLQLEIELHHRVVSTGQ
ncbi:RING finger protein [Pyrenophora tritici-repentis]|uniref:RING finger protein n=1 Tax=Pyrenophora tritici-repentis TaxID=45151 RepID=A0A922SYN7_9PLEO|nr:RING finger protein [Pyrenophora tritici-repentis]KAI1684025.1 RING finger protein [Pyrenophora tritici-repentis]